MKTVALLAVLALGHALDLEVMPYKLWRRKFVTHANFEPHELLAAKRSDSNWDTPERQQQYWRNVATIKEHNKLHDAGKVSYRMGVNEYSDLTWEEFRSAVGLDHGFDMTKKGERNYAEFTHEPADEVDWRTKGAVTPVKNQKQCGSCWAFSTTGSTEGAVQIATGTLTSLSEQQLVDCSKREGNEGCNGGLMDYGFEYIIKNGGIDTEEDYPYTARNGRCDSAKADKKVSHITGYSDVHPDSVKDMQQALTQQPVSVAIEADKEAFQHYKSGVFSDPTCGTKLDHGVLAVGYNADAWIVKNSWGETWGDKGYIQMKLQTFYNRKGECGILAQPSFPTIKSSTEDGHLHVIDPSATRHEHEHFHDHHTKSQDNMVYNYNSRNVVGEKDHTHAHHHEHHHDHTGESTSTMLGGDGHDMIPHFSEDMPSTSTGSSSSETWEDDSVDFEG